MGDEAVVSLKWYERPVGRRALREHAQRRKLEIYAALSAGHAPEVVADVFGISEQAVALVAEEYKGFRGLIHMAQQTS